MFLKNKRCLVNRQSCKFGNQSEFNLAKRLMQSDVFWFVDTNYLYLWQKSINLK